MPKLKFQYFDHLMWRAVSLGKNPDAGKDWGQENKGATEDEMVGWHHGFNGHEFEQTLGDSEGQGGLTCCSPWGCKESDNILATEQQLKELQDEFQFDIHITCIPCKPAEEIYGIEALNESIIKIRCNKNEPGRTTIGWL